MSGAMTPYALQGGHNYSGEEVVWFENWAAVTAEFELREDPSAFFWPLWGGSHGGGIRRLSLAEAAIIESQGGKAEKYATPGREPT